MPGPRGRVPPRESPGDARKRAANSRRPSGSGRERREAVLEWEVRAQVCVRRRDSFKDWVALDPEDAQFAIAALGGDSHKLYTDRRMRQTLRKLKIIVPAAEAPASAEELSFKLELSREVLTLLPAESDEAAGAWVVNPRIFLQTSEALPPAIADSVHFEPQPSHGPLTFSQELPRLWITDPRTEMVFPLWMSGSWRDALHRIARDGRLPARLSGGARRALRAARILVSADELRPDNRIWSGQASLAKDGYIKLSGLLPPLWVAGLRAYYRKLGKQGFFKLDDEQVVRQRAGVYRDCAAMFVGDQTARVVSHFVPRPCRQSYTWYFLYASGAVLARHTDRPQCRWNVSLCVDNIAGLAADRWPLHLEHNGQKTVALEMGDGVLYSGVDTPHWRDALPEGHGVGNMFLHYVDHDFEGSLN
jgi:hypothetical protein